jgi:preprotein translocase subunit YajC
VKFHAILAQAVEGQPAEAPKGPAGPPQVPFLMRPEVMMAVAVLFVLFFILPQSRRQKKEAAARLAAMKPGAKVVTTGGIVGRIVSLKDGEDEVVIKSDDTKMRVLKTAIAQVMSDDTPADVKS